MKPDKISPGFLALIGSVFIWGSTFVITKALMSSIGPLTVTGIRLVISLAVLLPISLKRGFAWRMLIQWKYLAYGLTGVALFFGFSNFGLQLSTAGNAALIQAANPAAIALFSFLFLKEQISRQKTAGIALSIFGVVLVAGIPSGDQPSMLAGNLLLAGSVISWAIYTVQGRKMPEALSPVTTTTVSFFTGLFWLFPFIVWEIVATGLPQIDPTSWFALFYLGLFASALAFFFWNYGLERVEASQAAPLINLIPIIGLFFSLLAGEHVSAIQVIGGLTAIIGVIITQNGYKFVKRAEHENPDTSH